MMKKSTFTGGLPLLRSADRLEMMDGIDCLRQSSLVGDLPKSLAPVPGAGFFHLFTRSNSIWLVHK
jgi:hypothetical protein